MTFAPEHDKPELADLRYRHAYPTGPRMMLVTVFEPGIGYVLDWRIIELEGFKTDPTLEEFKASRR